jgi:diphosphomevalonate decarboxylase
MGVRGVLDAQLSENFRYWGKRDTKLILPTNSSLSVTLDQDHLRSTTTSRADPSFASNRLWLNGTEDEIKPGGRLSVCIAEMKRLRAEYEEAHPNEPKVRCGDALAVELLLEV